MRTHVSHLTTVKMFHRKLPGKRLFGKQHKKKLHKANKKKAAKRNFTLKRERCFPSTSIIVVDIVVGYAICLSLVTRFYRMHISNSVAFARLFAFWVRWLFVDIFLLCLFLHHRFVSNCFRVFRLVYRFSREFCCFSLTHLLFFLKHFFSFLFSSTVFGVCDGFINLTTCYNPRVDYVMTGD